MGRVAIRRRGRVAVHFAADDRKTTSQQERTRENGLFAARYCAGHGETCGESSSSHRSPSVLISPKSFV